MFAAQEIVTATIDRKSLTSSSRSPIISGTAINANEIKVWICADVNDCRPELSLSPAVPVLNGRWTTQLDGPLHAGTFTVFVYTTVGTLLTSGALFVTQ